MEGSGGIYSLRSRPGSIRRIYNVSRCRFRGGESLRCSATYLISSIEILLLLNLSLDFNPLLILEYDFLVETEKMDAGGSAGIGIAGTVCSTYLSYSENDRDLLVLILRLGTSSIDVREVAVVEIDACEPVEAVRACLDSTVTADSHRET